MRNCRSKRILEKIRKRARRFGGRFRDFLVIRAIVRSHRRKKPVTKIGFRSLKDIFYKKANGLAGNGYFEMYQEGYSPIRIPWKKIIKIEVVGVRRFS